MERRRSVRQRQNEEWRRWRSHSSNKPPRRTLRCNPRHIENLGQKAIPVPTYAHVSRYRGYHDTIHVLFVGRMGNMRARPNFALQMIVRNSCKLAIEKMWRKIIVFQKLWRLILRSYVQLLVRFVFYIIRRYDESTDYSRTFVCTW